MANPKKPRHLKVIAGTIQPYRDTAERVLLPTLSECPPPPEWLPNSHAVKEWQRLTPILVANKLLTEAALSALGLLCAIHGKIVQLYTAGETPAAAILSQYRNLINDFGLTPVAHGKVTPAGEGPQGNRFARNGKRPSK